MPSNIDTTEFRVRSELAGAQSDSALRQEAVLGAFGARASAEYRNELPQLQKTDSLQPTTGTKGCFLGGFVDGAIVHPADAVRQLCGANLANSATADSSDTNGSTSHRVGEIVGSLVPYIGIGLITHNVANGILGKAEQSAMRIVGEQASNGFILGAAFTPTESNANDSLLAARIRQGMISSATFAAMAGTGASLSKYVPQIGQDLLPTLSKRVGIGLVSGTVGGVVDAEARNDFNADGKQLFSSALGYAAFGALAEAGTSLAKPIFAEVVKPTQANPQLRATELLAADAKTTIISSPGAWYDNLQRAIYKAPPEHTIIVTNERWLQEAGRMAKDAKRPDIKLILDTPEAEANKAQVSDTTWSNAAKADAAVAASNKISTWEARSKLIENLRKEVNLSGEDPLEALTAALKRGRAVMVGEYHVSDSINRALGAKLMPQLKEAGLTHLAIEHSSDFAGKIFDANGKLDIDSLPALLRHHEFYDLLNSANKAGIEIVPVDSALEAARDLASRNVHMDQKIADILENPDNKVLYWVGNRHLQMLDTTGEGPQVAKLLRDRGIALTTFYGQHDNFWREEPVRNLFTPHKPLAVPTAQAPTLSALSWLHDDSANHTLSKFSEFDYVLMYPHQTPSHYD